MQTQARRRLILAGTLFAVSLLGVLVVAFSFRREPVYQGRTLSSWMNAFPTSWTEVGKPGKSHEDQMLAIGAIDHMGTNAIPMFLQWLQAEDTPMKAKIIMFLQSHPGVPYQPLSASQKRMLAIQGLHALGPKARIASKEMLKIASASDARTERQIRDVINSVLVRDSIDAQINTIHPPENLR